MDGQEQQAKESQSRQQMAFTWKAGYREQWQPAFEAWAERQPKGQQAAQDFILHLLRQAARAGESGAIRARFDELDLKALADAHYARRAAEDRMLDVIADMIAGAREQAAVEVKAEIDRLRESATFAQEQARKTEERAESRAAALQEEIGSWKAEAEAQRAAKDRALAELEAAKAEVAQLTGEVASLETDKEEAEEQAQAEIARLSAELDKAREQADEWIRRNEEQAARLDRAIADLESARLEIQDLRQAVSMGNDRENGLKDNIRRLQGDNADLSRKLEEAGRKLADTEQAADENWQEFEKADKELQEARIRIAALEGELKATGASGKALSDALAAIAAMKRTKWPEGEGQQPSQAE